MMPKNKKESNPSEQPGASAKASNSPFKFLAPYSAEDKDAFWGRDAEIKELYEMLFATNLVLLYGPSGTGKTSLIQCGLSKKFSGPDWIPLMIRRGENFISSLKKDLQSISGLAETSSIPEHIIHTYNTYYRPVYLFFDQFEEIFTLADRDKNGKVLLDTDGELSEVKELFTTLQQLATTLPCKVVFSFREEFLGQLYNYEQYLPTLFDFRLRVEPMNTARINEVLEGSFGYFNISCTPPEVASAIADNLLEGKATSQLAYLQVYMDKLWKTALAEGSGQVWQKGTPLPPVTISTHTLNRVGDVRKVLEVYLQEQEESVANALGVPQTWVRELLDSFVTDDGTKRPIAENSPKLNPKNRLNAEQQAKCLTLLEGARLLRKDNQYYELAHDTLAGILANKRTASQRLVKEITQSIRTSYNLPTEGEGSYLNEEYVSLYDKYLPEINEELEGTEDKQGIIDYIEESRANNENRKRTLEDKNRRLRRSLIRSRQFVAGILVLLAISIGTVFFAWLINNNSTALYWVSEAEKMIPTRKLRLLDAAVNRTNEKNIVNSIKDQIVKTFNGSRAHGFIEKIRYDNFVTSSANEDWVTTRFTDADGSEEVLVWNTLTGDQFDFLKEKEAIDLTEFSPDGRWLLTSNKARNRCLIWETSTQEKYATLKNEGGFAEKKFSNDGKWLYTRNSMDQSRVWDLANKKRLTYLDNEKGVRRTLFSPDSKWLLTVDINNNHKVWDITQKRLVDFLKNEQSLFYATFSEDGKWLITTNAKGQVSVWNMATGRVPAFLGGEGAFKLVTFSANGNWLITNNAKNEVKLWDVARRQVPEFLSQVKDIKSATISGDGEWLLTSNAKKEYRVWNTGTGAFHDSLKTEKGIYLSEFSPDGKWILTSKNQGEYVLWETASGTRYDFLIAVKDIAMIKFSANGQRLLTQTNTGEYRVWEIASGQPWDFIKTEKDINDARFSPDGKRLYTFDAKNSMRVWEVDRKRRDALSLGEIADEALEFSGDDQWFFTRDRDKNTHVLETSTGQPADFLKRQTPIRNGEFFAKGKWLCTRNERGALTVWDVTKGKVPDFLKEERDMQDAVFSENGQWLLTSSGAGRTALWQTTTGQKRSLPQKGGAFWFTDLSPDGKWIITKNEANEAALWKTDSLKRIDFFPNDGRHLETFKFSADSKWIATTDSEERYQLWETGTRQPHDFLAQRKGIQEVIFAADGTWLITNEGTANYHVWDLATGKAPDFLREGEALPLAQFSADGKFLITTDSKRKYYVWNMATQGVPDFLQSDLDLTHAEFSTDGKWLFTKSGAEEYAIWETHTGRKFDFLKNEKTIELATFSTDGRYLATASNKKITTWEIARGKAIQRLYLNSKPTQIKLAQNCALYATVGRALIKTDFTNEDETYFSYGDRETLDYTYDEINEWITVFGGDYLGELDQQTKQKYRIEKKFNLVYDMLKTFWDEFKEWVSGWFGT